MFPVTTATLTNPIDAHSEGTTPLYMTLAISGSDVHLETWLIESDYYMHDPVFHQQSPHTKHLLVK